MQKAEGFHILRSNNKIIDILTKPIVKFVIDNNFSITSRSFMRKLASTKENGSFVVGVPNITL